MRKLSKDMEAFASQVEEERDRAVRAAYARGSVPLATVDEFDKRCALVRTALQTGAGSPKQAVIALAHQLFAVFVTDQLEMFTEESQVPGPTDAEIEGLSEEEIAIGMASAHEAVEAARGSPRRRLEVWPKPRDGAP